MFQMLSQVSLAGLFSLAVSVLPLGFGFAYAIRPTEQKLALMRPISLAAIFAGLSGSLSGFISVLQMVWTNTQPPVEFRVLSVGIAESLVPMFVAFGSLTIAWLCAAAGLRRHP